KGLLIPRMTSAQRTAISSPPQGLMVFQNNGTSSLGFWYHDGTTWQRFAKASELTGSSSWTVTGLDQYSNVDGNVGIGLTSGISEKLTLRGDLFIQNDTVTDHTELLFQSQTGSNGGSGIIRFLEPDNTTTGGLIQYRPLYNVLSISNELADDAALYIYENENIGIGGNYITDAISKLQILGGNPNANLSTSHGFMVIGSTFSENIVFGKDEILARYNGATSPLILQEEGGVVKIGSGTAGADTRLHIFGGGESSLTTHGYMVLGSINSINMVFDGNEIQARSNGSASVLRLQQDGGSLLIQGNALSVSTSGNVGIGTLSPASLFHVNGSSILGGAISVFGDATFSTVNPTLQLQNSGVDKGFVQLSGDNIRIGTNSANDLGKFIIRNNGLDRVFVDPAGNMGVGVASPAAKLDVAGKIRIGATGEALKIDGNGSFIQFYLNGVAKTYMQQLGNDLRIGNSSGNSTGRLYLFGDEVAINTSGPASGYSLSVGGEIICEELRVELQGNGPWPDYVFAKEYKLKPLAELKSFVQENKHLPNIPAAAQVEDEGFDVGDMNRRLLEKVEELTLYIIQQQEEIDALKVAVQKQ
ncbi:MAG TPA: hypothetical protein VI603_03240, partial [Saprospiraceae bacterium]|nr:hypothetical protein [Saprospiraceae bacterium]